MKAGTDRNCAYERASDYRALLKAGRIEVVRAFNQQSALPVVFHPLLVTPPSEFLKKLKGLQVAAQSFWQLAHALPKTNPTQEG